MVGQYSYISPSGCKSIVYLGQDMGVRRVEVYDLNKDPTEREDLANTEMGRKEGMKATEKIRGAQAEVASRAKDNPNSKRIPYTEKEREDLRALGYLN